MRRTIIISLAVTIGVTMVVIVFLQRNRVFALKWEQAQILARLDGAAETSLPVVRATAPSAVQSSYSPSIELLKLRAEVAMLGNRKRELANIRAESERLHSQLATRRTNAPGAVVLPVGYIKRSEAKFVGYSTPEETIQSLLWAIQNWDAARFLEALDSETAKQLEAQMQSRASIEEFFKEADSLPGMHILGKEAGDNGETVLTVEIMPNEKTQIRFKQVGGQWKMVSGF